eukprot:8649279-Lingulodinium_polyedra.AAC.1
MEHLRLAGGRIDDDGHTGVRKHTAAQVLLPRLRVRVDGDVTHLGIRERPGLLPDRVRRRLGL